MSKIWFITGCSKGLGRFLTEEILNTTQDTVAATARDPNTLSDLQQQFPDRLLPLKLDVKNTSDIKTSVAAVIEKFGRIDVLVNNAGYGLVGALEECPLDDIKALFETNVFGLIAVTQAVIPHMRKQNSGHIINLSSIAGLLATAGAGMYNSSKFAVEGLSEALAQELSHFDIHVSIIEPGPFRTDFGGTNSIVISNPLPAYDNTPTAQMRQYVKDAHNNQIGDPQKAAKIMIELTQMDNPPLRLILGNPAFDAATTKLTDKLNQLKALESTSRSADFDEQANALSNPYLRDSK